MAAPVAWNIRRSPALVTHITVSGMAASTAIALLIFCGAAGKSGQVPLHVWLPDAMEGPTPVSALIHAATMVAAGVFLIARVYPLMSAHTGAGLALTPTTALIVVTWVGAITAVFAALIATAQWDIKRILAYSTVSQLGYMMMGLGIGGVAVGMFHLITHAFFKSLLFLGAGSVIHGCNGEQDIRKMGGLRKLMPITFADLCGRHAGALRISVVLRFLEQGRNSPRRQCMEHLEGPLLSGRLRRVADGLLYDAAGLLRVCRQIASGSIRVRLRASRRPTPHATPHESPAVMTIPLTILAAFALLLGLVDTPVWPWFHSFLSGTPAAARFTGFSEPGLLAVMISSSIVVFLGLGLGWYFYGRKPIISAEAPDPVGRLQPHIFTVLAHAFYIDALYAATLLRLNAAWSRICDWLDRWVWNGAVQTVSHLVLAFAWIDNLIDTKVVNAGFDEGCETVSRGGQILSLLQGGRVQSYLRMIGIALIALAGFLLWGATR